MIQTCLQLQYLILRHIFTGLISFYISCPLRMLLQSSKNILIWPQVKKYYFKKFINMVLKNALTVNALKSCAKCSYEKVTDRKMKELWLLLQFAKVFELFHINFFSTFSTILEPEILHFIPVLIFEEYWHTNYGEDTETKIPFLYSFSGNRGASVQISTFAWVCERFIYSQDRSTYFLQQNRQIDRGNV